MNKTWALGAIELLGHADGHIKLDTAFDKRIAFISIDNSVEVTIKTYLSLPKQFFGLDRPSKKELDECNNTFTNYLSLLFKYADKKLIGIEPGDIEHYHRIRNKLYHDGTGLGVDQQYLNAYFTIAKLLLKRLFGIDFQEQKEDASLEKLILNWNYIEEYLAKIFATDLVHADTYKWEEAVSKGLLTMDIIKNVTELRLSRNRIVHSKSIDSTDLVNTFNRSKYILKELQKLVNEKLEIINSRNFFFEPSISEITGILTFNSFYGPPNYGETPEQDIIENVWILNLDAPINVHQVKQVLGEGDYNSTQFDVNRVQLAKATDHFDLNIYKDKKIIAKGTFWGAHTGHHFTPVLMDVISIIANTHC